MQARKEARARGELKQDEFVYVDHLGNFRDTPPDPDEKEEVNLAVSYTHLTLPTIYSV